jgi:hypothetical protein
MRVVLLSDPPDFSAYLAEMLQTWGLALYEFLGPEQLPGLEPADAPVVICPPCWEGSADDLVDYVRRGGAVICFLPGGALAAAAGLETQGEKEGPLRLRITSHPAAGLAGETVPVVGRAATYRHLSEPRTLAYLSHPGRYDGESAAITETDVGRGKIIAFAFDLPLCVLLLRQGDPDRAEVIPPGDGCARPSHLAADIGPNDAGWIPFADLLSRLFVDLVRHCLPAPAPLLSHLPGAAPGILLYSGDEDNADVASNDEEFDCIAAAGGRMNLYIIPTNTRSTPSDVQRYLARHDIGPHPNLRPLDGSPVAERIAEFERQIRMFQDMFQVSARSLRNHCTAWAGYMQPVEVMENLGVRMDANYFSGAYLRDRESAPYIPFGAAMPMRFCRPNGELLDVFQQHTHLTDDAMFASVDYSYKLSPSVFSVVLDRIFRDITTRFHTPYGVCIHPGNWVRFSRPQGQELLRQAKEKDLPIWSFDRWSEFWEARDTWRFHSLSRSGSNLKFTLEGRATHDALRLTLPMNHNGTSLTEVSLNGEIADRQQVVRYGESVVLVPLPAKTTSLSVNAVYE